MGWIRERVHEIRWRTHRRRIALVSVAWLVLACDSGSMAGLDAEGSLAGHYQGGAEWTREGVRFSVRASITFEESLDGIAGGFLTNRGQRGTVHGTMDGTTMTFQIDQSEPCAGVLVGMGSFSPLDHGRVRLTGTYSGETLCLGIVQATFDLVRYPPFQPLALRDDAHVLVGGFAF